jgi:hypothetical protein
MFLFLFRLESVVVSRLKTSDDIVQNCSDEDILKMSANLKRKFIESIDDNGKSIDLYTIEYESLLTLSEKEIKTFGAFIMFIAFYVS